MPGNTPYLPPILCKNALYFAPYISPLWKCGQYDLVISEADTSCLNNTRLHLVTWKYQCGGVLYIWWQCVLWVIMAKWPIHPTFKTYPPNLKGFQAKTMRKWCFLNPYLMHFCSEWQPWFGGAIRALGIDNQCQASILMLCSSPIEKGIDKASIWLISYSASVILGTFLAYIDLGKLVYIWEILVHNPFSNFIINK